MPAMASRRRSSYFHVSIDLVQEARAHWAFLKRAYERKWIHEDFWLRYAIWRYETKWLPLVASHQAEDIEPPMDVHWVWHVHLLCPIKYVEDCMQLVHCIPDHKLRLNKADIVKAQENARSLWSQRYPTDPFEVTNILPSNYETMMDNFRSRCSYDIFKAAQRQSAFFYNVALPHYLDQKFLEVAVDRYKKFIALKKMKPKLFVVPMYDVDLIWHTHQLYPSAYRNDMESFLGRVLNHDDSTTDRSADSKLTLSDLETRHAWQEMYKEPFPQPGTMYRGIEPVGRLYTLVPAQLLELGAIVCKLRIKSVAADIPNAPARVGGHLLIKSEEFETMDVKLPTKKHKPFVWFSEYREPYFCEFIVDTNFAYTIKVVLQQKRDGIMGIIGGKVSLGILKIDPIPLIEEMPKNTYDFSAEGETKEGIKVKLSGELCKEFGYRSVVAGLRVCPGHFEKAVLPEDIEQLWGPITLPRLPPHVPNDCQVASHTLFSPRGKLVMTVRVVHSLPLRLSAIQVFYGDAMVSVGHLIHSDQLPKPEQLQAPNKCVPLNPKVGERAIIIKNNAGDWGLVQTMWRGYTKGGTDAASEGHLEVAFTHLRSLRRDRTQVLPLQKGYAPTRMKSFKLAGVTVDLESGIITPNGETSVPESVALAFSVLTLFVLCQPRRDIAETGRIIQSVIQRNILHNSSGEFIDAQQYELLVASGFHCETPSNSWLHWHMINQRQQYHRHQARCSRPGRHRHRDSWTSTDTSSSSSRFGSDRDDDMDHARKDRDGEFDDGHMDELLDPQLGQHDGGDAHIKLALCSHESEDHGDLHNVDLHDHMVDAHAHHEHGADSHVKHVLSGTEGEEHGAAYVDPHEHEGIMDGHGDGHGTAGAETQQHCGKLDGHDHLEEHDIKDHVLDDGHAVDCTDTGADHGHGAYGKEEKADEMHDHAAMDGATDGNPAYDSNQMCDRDQWMGDTSPWTDRGRDGSDDNLALNGKAEEAGHTEDFGHDIGGFDDDKGFDDHDLAFGDHDHDHDLDHDHDHEVGGDNSFLGDGGGDEEDHTWGEPQEDLWDDAAGDGWIGDTCGGENYGGDSSGVDGYVVGTGWSSSYVDDNWGDMGGGGGGEDMGYGGGAANSDDEYDGGEYILDSDGGGDSDHGGFDGGGGGCGGGGGGGIDDDD